MRKYGQLLLIEDEVELANALAMALAPHFEKIHISHNGADALKVIESTTLSVILTDYNMPTLSGTQVVRQLRAKGNLTPVIFITGGATLEIALSALRLGVGDLVEKPFSPEELMHTIDRVLEIEKRKRIHYSKEASETLDARAHDKKMIGLLHVVNEKKKVS